MLGLLMELIEILMSTASPHEIEQYRSIHKELGAMHNVPDTFEVQEMIENAMDEHQSKGK